MTCPSDSRKKCNSKKNEIFTYFYIKHFEICPEICNFALEIRKHFEEWMQIIAYSKGNSMSGC